MEELVPMSMFLAKGGAFRLEDRMGWVGTAEPKKATLEVLKVMVEDLDRSKKKDRLVKRKVLGVGYRYEEWRVALVPSPEKRERGRKVEKKRRGRRFL